MRGLQLTPNTWNNIPPIIDITDVLPKQAPWETVKKKNIVKGVWDGTWHTGFRKLEDIDTIIIHHSGPPNGTLESHANTHARKWGAGIAYHVAIDQGQIKQVNDLRSFTYHAGGNNTYTVGIMVNRNITKDNDLTDKERELLYAAILSVKAAIPSIKYIKGHNEVSATACPVTSVSRIKADIASLEEKISYESTLDSQKVLGYAFAMRIQGLHQRRDDPKVGAECIRKILLLTPILPQLGFAKEITPTNIYERIAEIHNNSFNKNSETEAFRKLLIGANYAKQLGLL